MGLRAIMRSDTDLAILAELQRIVRMAAGPIRPEDQ
jgi:hypothetical protein